MKKKLRSTIIILLTTQQIIYAGYWPSYETAYCSGEGQEISCNQKREEERKRTFTILDKFEKTLEERSSREIIQGKLQEAQRKFEKSTHYIKAREGFQSKEGGEKSLCSTLPSKYHCQWIEEKKIIKNIMKLYFISEYIEQYTRNYSHHALTKHNQREISKDIKKEKNSLAIKAFDSCKKLNSHKDKERHNDFIKRLITLETQIDLNQSQDSTDVLKEDTVDRINEDYEKKISRIQNPQNDHYGDQETCISQDQEDIVYMFKKSNGIDSFPLTYNIKDKELFLPPEFNTYKTRSPKFGKRINDYIIITEESKGMLHSSKMKGRYYYTENKMYIEELCINPEGKCKKEEEQSKKNIKNHKRRNINNQRFSYK